MRAVWGFRLFSFGCFFLAGGVFAHLYYADESAWFNVVVFAVGLLLFACGAACWVGARAEQADQFDERQRAVFEAVGVAAFLSDGD